MIRRCYHIIGCSIVIFLLFSASLCAQERQSVNWLTFEQLEDSLNANPKKVFLDFYTDWCTYCRKMDKVVFTKPEVVRTLNEQYYAVRFDAESETAIAFGSQTFVNDQLKKSRKPVHQIAQLLALRGGAFIPPTMILLDENFKVTSRHFEYLDSKQLLQLLDP